MHRSTLVLVLGCAHPAPEPSPAATAPQADAIDRFSPSAGHLMVRGGVRALPAPGAAIDFDRPPFITQAFGPDGKVVRYYNFDVQPTTPAIMYRITHAGERTPIAGQLDIVDALPGDASYSDFARIAWVDVPATFVPGSVKSRGEILAAHFAITDDTQILDCPIVPHGSSAREGNGVAPAVPVQLWYRGATIDCLRFGDPLDGPTVPTSPIYVTFGHEPAAGFKREGATPQTHNVVLSVPGDADYSPLWEVHVYDARAFELVHDAATAQKARIVEAGKLVNCPIVSVQR